MRKRERFYSGIPSSHRHNFMPVVIVGHCISNYNNHNFSYVFRTNAVSLVDKLCLRKMGKAINSRFFVAICGKFGWVEIIELVSFRRMPLWVAARVATVGFYQHENSWMKPTSGKRCSICLLCFHWGPNIWSNNIPLREAIKIILNESDLFRAI